MLPVADEGGVLPVAEEVALRPSRNHHWQNVRTLRLAGGGAFWLDRGRAGVCPPAPLPAPRGLVELWSGLTGKSPLSNSHVPFRGIASIFLWITGLSVGGL